MFLFLLGSCFLWWKYSYNTKQQVVELEKNRKNENVVEIGHSEETIETEQRNVLSDKTMDRELIVGTERVVETRAVLLQTNLEDGDLVDVRIRYPNGEEYVVLAKRGCHELEKIEGRVTFFLTEEEILCLSSSIVDCIQFDATLYTVRYLRDKKEMSAVVNYIPREDVCQLMIDNPNIIGELEFYLQNKERKSLENRMKDWMVKLKKKIKVEQNHTDNHEEKIHNTLDREEGSNYD